MEKLDGWWRRNQGGGISSRLNEIVQWMRDIFNESLDKAEYVQSRRDALQKSDFDVNITAEKLLFDRALEMSRAAAVSEMMGEDYENCGVSYGTALYMLEAILEADQQDDGLGDTDRALVEKFIEHVGYRLAKLQRKLEGSQMATSGRPPSLSSSPLQIGYDDKSTATASSSPR
jgi:serine/threonine-protein kinase ULK/ATG1